MASVVHFLTKDSDFLKIWKISPIMSLYIASLPFHLSFLPEFLLDVWWGLSIYHPLNNFPVFTFFLLLLDSGWILQYSLQMILVPWGPFHASSNLLYSFISIFINSKVSIWLLYIFFQFTFIIISSFWWVLSNYLSFDILNMLALII